MWHLSPSFSDNETRIRTDKCPCHVSTYVTYLDSVFTFQCLNHSVNCWSFNQLNMHLPSGYEMIQCAMKLHTVESCNLTIFLSHKNNSF